MPGWQRCEATYFCQAAITGLPRDSVASVTAIVTLDKSEPTQVAGTLTANLLADVDSGLRQVLSLS
jgi:mRNA interferase MazF